MTTPHLLQVFLGKRGADEVSVMPGTHELTCTCLMFTKRQDCCHIDYVYERTVNGDYFVELPEHAVETMKDNLVGDPVAWRMFVIENAPVVVL